MLISFKSKYSPDVLMYQEHAQPILDLLHKSPARGIITAAEVPEALATLEREVIESRLRQQQEAEQEAAAQEKDENDELREQIKARRIDFGTRAFPLMEMLRSAKAEGKDIVWGV
ncbi:DUF1840 domain-containing protein [Janthinobacterium fluminis]|uniref:DUF1840 domain-containing protein n=1 Tax=Janthinobacterium fluminis TaxID=2987524 RepID=A0ABT5K6E9_9BURK|nr:DUF1840 domain-containing protein [Janthinobacterium fluminis]MDC8760580.1 DUF1840 domain-containing protein [Janthinobacterium fluminis]